MNASARQEGQTARTKTAWASVLSTLRYTANTVSKLLSAVVTLNEPAVEAVHWYQMECVPEVPGTPSYSPASLPAARVEPNTVTNGCTAAALSTKNTTYDRNKRNHVEGQASRAIMENQEYTPRTGAA